MSLATDVGRRVGPYTIILVVIIIVDDCHSCALWGYLCICTVVTSGSCNRSDPTLRLTNPLVKNVADPDASHPRVIYIVSGIPFYSRARFRRNVTTSHDVIRIGAPANAEE